MQCDKHIPKMCVESAQLLCAALRLEGVVDQRLYKLSHAHNPLVKWVRKSSSNYEWLLVHLITLLDEYSYRYSNKTHATSRLVSLLEFYIAVIPPGPQTPFVQCMPAEFKQDNTVEAYRAYYHSKSFAKWNKTRQAPIWWKPL